jgi:hypothetical protein
MNKHRKISITGIENFADCPKKYKYRYVDRRYRLSNEHTIFGVVGHKVMQYVGMGLKDDIIYTYIDQELERESVKRALTKLKITNLRALVNDYIYQAHELLSRYIIIRTEVFIEDEDNIGVIDVVAVDVEEQELLLLDYKFSKYIKDEDYILDELQLYMYSKLLNSMPNIKDIIKKYKIRKVSLGYYTLSKKETQIPKKLVSGKLSKAKNDAVTYDSFMEAITLYGLDSEDYKEHLEGLKEVSDDVIRFAKMKLSRGELEEKLKEIEMWNKIITFCVENDLFPGRNSWNCKGCEIKKQCKSNI